jgi:hypothetical protein
MLSVADGWCLEFWIVLRAARVWVSVTNTHFTKPTKVQNISQFFFLAFSLAFFCDSACHFFWCTLMRFDRVFVPKEKIANTSIIFLRVYVVYVQEQVQKCDAMLC